MAIVSSGKLWFVVDRTSLASYPPLAKGAGAAIVLLARATPDELAGAAALFIDVDMTVRESVARLKLLLARVSPEVPRYFAVDLGKRVELVHAGVFGARATARRPFTARTVHTMLGLPDPAMAGTDATHAPVTLEKSVDMAADALAGMFASLVAHAGIDTAALDLASTSMAESIGERGLSVWLDTVRAHHDGTFQHCLVVTGVLTNFGVGTGMGESDIATLTKAGLLHDIGKAAIPVDILDKPGRLTDDEFLTIKQHPQLGYDFLREQDACSPEVMNAVRDHHEFLDGSGYPRGIDRTGIGDLTRIVTICDIYGALIESRSYKPPMPHDIAMSVLNDLATRGKVERALVLALDHAITRTGEAERQSA